MNNNDNPTLGPDKDRNPYFPEMGTKPVTAEEIENIIKKELAHLQRQPFRSSVEHFFKTGTINGSFLEAIQSAGKQISEQNANQSRSTGGAVWVTVVYKDGSWITVDRKSAWEYENDPNFLTTIPLIPSTPSEQPADRVKELDETIRQISFLNQDLHNQLVRLGIAKKDGDERIEKALLYIAANSLTGMVNRPLFEAVSHILKPNPSTLESDTKADPDKQKQQD